jgi:DNA-binding transcriptional regulator YiaG
MSRPAKARGGPVTPTGNVKLHDNAGAVKDHRLMNGNEMAAILKRLGWSNGELARRLNVREMSVSQWINGRRGIPDNLAEWLVEMVDHMDRAPPLPRGWKSS